MPTTKSSTLTSPLIQQLADNQDYRALLVELLSVIHRDGGQYTELAGFAVSTEEAIARIGEMRMEITNLFRERRKRG